LRCGEEWIGRYVIDEDEFVVGFGGARRQGAGGGKRRGRGSRAGKRGSAADARSRPGGVAKRGAFGAI
jgi:hypothetical protein